MAAALGANFYARVFDAAWRAAHIKLAASAPATNDTIKEQYAMKTINPCLWFETNAEEAMNFYTSIFPNSKKGKLTYYGDGMHMPKGTVLTATFSLNGNEFMALNGGPNDKFNHAISLMVNCDTQAEIDHLWDKLGDGGTIEQCGWVRDKYGVAWQIIPSRLREWMEGGDAAQTQRLMGAVMTMVKLDIAAMEEAARG